ncbi:MAG TPA: heparan-alpha-glucosaminide N-acetyltransferase domain-containing protein [Candidatus Binatia bacterium]|nr:heparan-alpha-glucosaminide N-acetyltransferase domain-containing protein [Candidatus Binatia bacterium]
MSAEKKRFYFIDQFRGWAVLFMVETHVVNAFLLPGLRSSPAYRALDFFNGLIAPAFLFIAGFSFAIVAGRRWDGFLRPGKVFGKQFLRCLQILLIGYLLHVPQFSLPLLLRTLKWSEKNIFWGVDVLHAIALSLLLMLLFIPIWRRRERYFVFLTAAGLAVALLTPWLRSLPLEKALPWALSGYLKRLPFSQFPLFPWMGFAFLGAAASWFWQTSRRSGDEARFFKLLFIVGASLVAVFSVIVLQPFAHIVFGSFNPAKPLFFFLKLGLVLALLSLLWRLGQRNGERPVLVTRVGQESLPAYAFHIAVIYGGFSGPYGHSLAHLIGPTRSWIEVSAMAVVLILATGALSLGWHWLKQNRPLLAKSVFWLGAGLLVIYMIFRK